MASPKRKMAGERVRSRAAVGAVEAPSSRAAVRSTDEALYSAAEVDLEDLLLPILEDVQARTWIIDAIDQAATTRKGVAVIGEKGSGKSVAISEAIREFDEGERHRQRGQRRRVARIQSPRSRQRVDIMAAIHHGITGEHLELRENGRRIPEDVVLNDLVEDLQGANYAVLVFDEAENLSPVGLEVIRDIISRAESEAKTRYVGGRYRAAGVGVVLVGTPHLKQLLDATGEAGHRWLRTQMVGALSPARVASVYRRFLPCLEERAAEIGADAWERFVVRHFAPRAVPIRFVENHVREYVRRAANANPDIRSLKELPFDEQLFIQVWEQGYLDWTRER